MLNDILSRNSMDKAFFELVEYSMSCIGNSKLIEELNGIDMNKVGNELDMVSKKVDMNDKKVYLFSNGQRKEISNELVKNHQESLLNVNMIDIDSRNKKNEVEIDFRFTYLDEVVKYMNNEYDIDELNGIEFERFCRELMEINIPFGMDIMNRLFNGPNKYGVGWKNRCVVANGNEYKMIFDYMKLKLNNIKYNDSSDQVEYIINDTYSSIIHALSKFCEHEYDDYNELIENLDRKKVNLLINEDIIDMNNIDIHQFFFPMFSSFLKETILFGQEYDSYLREWLGNDYKWKLLYRASEHDYTAESFHEYCDDKWPTLVMIKSTEGWIFGGYTTQSWSGWSIITMI